MAFLDHASMNTESTLLQRLSQIVDTPFDRRYRKRTARIAALRAMSDADLAAMGLTRDSIVQHVFSAGSRQR